MSYFPIVMELKDRKCLVVGGGKVALRKVNVLLEFDASVSVVAPILMDTIKQISSVDWEEREFCLEDLKGREIVIAATDSKELNHQIGQYCISHGILVNAVDQIEDCSFIFPAYLKKGEVVAAFSTGGQSPVVTQYLKEKTRPVLTEQLGELTACLGRIREEVKEQVDTEASRKKVYTELLQLGLKKDTIPTEQEIREIIEKYKE